jgi:DNA-binding response OmpR family regulator
MRVLLVDDQPQSLMILTDILKTHWSDIELFRSTSGDTALDILDHHALDLVLVDWQMPSMCGLTLLQELQHTRASLPVILMSGVQVSHEDMRRAMVSGAWDYLRKPFEAVEVVARVENVLRLSRAHLEIARLNEAKDVVFQALSNHLVVGAQRMTLAMDLIKRYLPVKSDYLERLLDETYANQQSHQALLQELLNWSQQQFAQEPLHLQHFGLRSFLLQYGHIPGASKVSLRVNEAIWVHADPQLLQEMLQKLLRVFEPPALRCRVSASTPHVELILPVVHPASIQILMHWSAHCLEPHLSRKELVLYLRLQSFQQQLKAMGGDLAVALKSNVQEASLILKLSGALRA